MGQADERLREQRRWTLQPWRLLPPLLVLLTVLLIWATRFEQLLANQWAYPVTLLLVGLVAAVLVWRARPRRVPVTEGV